MISKNQFNIVIHLHLGTWRNVQEMFQDFDLIAVPVFQASHECIQIIDLDTVTGLCRIRHDQPNRLVVGFLVVTGLDADVPSDACLLVRSRVLPFHLLHQVS